jgi:hypothetical protein
MGNTLMKRPLLLVAIASLGFSTEALLVKLLTLSGLGSFQTVLVLGSIQVFGVALILTHWGTPVNSWLGETREEAGYLALRGILG